MPQNNQNGESAWYKLDNVAKIFPPGQSKRAPSYFRLSVTFKKPLKLDLLKRALKKSLKRYPLFQVNLKKGAFWFYFAQSDEIPPIMEDKRYPLMRLPKPYDKLLLRVFVHKRRLALEFAHLLTDGNGGLRFLRLLTAEYLSLQKIDFKRPEDFPDIKRIFTPEEAEDSFRKYYDPDIPATSNEKKAFLMPYLYNPPGIFHITCGIVPVNIIKEKAKSYQVSIGEFILAVYFDAMQSVLYQLPEDLRKRALKPIRVCVPVNLRQSFPSKTMRNFFLIVIPEINNRLGRYSFEELIKISHHSMQMNTDRKSISRQISRNVKSELHPLLRLFPIIIKEPVINMLYYRIGGKSQSSSLSNLGQVKMPQELQEHIERFEFYPTPLLRGKTSCGIISYQDKMYINFGSLIQEKELEKFFFRKLRDLEIPITIESNYRAP